MRKIVYSCDICGKTPENESKMYHIKARSLRFVNYANYDVWGADKKTIDICESCANDFQEYVKMKHLK